MFGKRKKAETVYMPADEPIFTDEEKAVLATFVQSPAYNKLSLYVRHMLLAKWLRAGCSDEYRQGFLRCAMLFTNPPTDIPEPLEEDEYTSMPV